MSTSDTLNSLFLAQRRAHDQEPYPAATVRIDRINRLIDLILSHQSELCEVVHSDFGHRSADLTRAFDILPSLHALKYARKHVRHWMKPQRHQSNFPYNVLGSRAYTRPLPLGVVGNISPWNFPLTLALSPMGGILAAGNRVMIKPSEFTPETSELLKKLVGRYFAPEEMAVVTGDAQVATEFSQLQFDHLLFTGSTSVARKVASSCAPNLVPTTLELGGKSPVIVGDTADIEDVAQKVMAAKTLNAGQICLAPDYLLVNKTRVDELVSAMQGAVQAQYPQGIESPDYTNLIQLRHVERLRAHLQDSAERGNRVIPLMDDHACTDDRRLAPHLVVVKDRAASIMQEELFGPLLPIVPIDSFDQVMPLVVDLHLKLTQDLHLILTHPERQIMA